MGVEGPVAGEFEARIEGGDAVEAAGEFATGEEGSDVGLLAEFALDAGDGDEGVSVAIGIVWSEGVAGRAIVNGEQAEIPAAELAGEARAEFGVSNAAGEEEVFGRDEVTGIFEEKWAFFGELDFEALVDGDLGIVGFDLAEIGIQGNVERERRVDDGFGVEAGAGRVLRFKRGDAGGGIIEEMGGGKGAIGGEADVAAGGDVFKASESA